MNVVSYAQYLIPGHESEYNDYVEMMGLSIQSVLRNLQGVDRIDVLVGKASWRGFLLDWLQHIHRLTQRGETVCVVGSDCLILEEVKLPWEADHMIMPFPANSRAGKDIRNGAFTLFPASLSEAVWDRGWAAWEQTSPAVYDPDQVALTAMYCSEENNPDKQGDLGFGLQEVTVGGKDGHPLRHYPGIRDRLKCMKKDAQEAFK